MSDVGADEPHAPPVMEQAHPHDPGNGRSRPLLGAIYAASSVGFLLLDESRRIVDLNPQMARMLGADRAALDRTDVVTLLPERLRARACAEHAAVLAGSEPSTGLWPFERGDGNFREFRITLERIGTGNDAATCLATVTDFSREQRRSREREDRAAVLELVTRQAPLKQIYERIAGLLRRRFLDGRVVITRREGTALLLEYAAGISEEVLLMISRQPLDPAHSPCTAAVLDGRLTVTADLQTDQRWARYWEAAAQHGVHADWVCPIPSESGDRFQGTIAVLHAERRLPSEAEAELLAEVANLAGLAMSRHRLVADLSHRAFHDALTGLPNRQRLEDRLAQILAKGGREADRVGVMLIDLDHFKLVNDTLGHDAGDELLVEVAVRLRSRLRPDDMIARLGGDEFVVMLPGADRTAAAAVAQSLIGILSAPVELRGEYVGVSPSIGIVLAEGGEGTPAALIRAADTAMYAAKAAGRNGFRFYDREAAPVPGDRAVLGRELRSSRFGGQLDVMPLARSTRSGRLCGVAVQLLWRYPDHAPMTPERFLQIAAVEGLLNRAEVTAAGVVRDYVLALQAAAPGTPLGYRVAELSIRDDDFPRRLREYLMGAGLPARLLELDLGAGLTSVADARRLPDLAARLRADLPGVRIALGGMEGAHIAMRTLRAVKPDTIGIGGLLVKDLDAERPEQRAEARELLRHTVGIARRLGRWLVAEDVTSEAQWETLRAMGVCLGQGPLFSDLLPAIKVERPSF